MLVQMADQVAMAVNNALAFRQIQDLRDRLGQEKEYLEQEIALEQRFEDVVGESKGLRRVLSGGTNTIGFRLFFRQVGTLRRLVCERRSPGFPVEPRGPDAGVCHAPNRGRSACHHVEPQRGDRLSVVPRRQTNRLSRPEAAAGGRSQRAARRRPSRRPHAALGGGR